MQVKKVPVPYENLLTINTIGLTGSVSPLKEIKAEYLENFIKCLKETLEVNVKKVQEARKGIKNLIWTLLWDYPFNERFLNRNTPPLLMRRSQKPLSRKGGLIRGYQG
ncbi:MAG: hypothetical protein GWP10_22470 [Nitrospiraceae bacterium]|nr:hypothetical protein [Nitrospiraceae bacterium]